MPHSRAGHRLSPSVWQVVRFVVGIGLAVLALWALNGQRNELVGASAMLAKLRSSWVALGAVSELACFICFAGLQRRLLAAGGIDIPLGSMTVLSLAAGAIADSLPGGPAFASVYAFRFYRRRHADEAVAGWTLLATLVFAALALGLLSAAGVLLAFRQGASYDLIGVIFGVLVISVIADAVVWQRSWLAKVMDILLLATRRLFGRPKRHGLEVVEDLLAQLSAVRVGIVDLFGTLLWALGNWIFDCGCLACSFVAVDASVPWRGLLLAYGAGQLAANLPITPGGLGVVEGSLTIALVAFGGAEVSTVAAVLLYRIVSFWAYLPVGWIAFGGIAIADHRSRHPEAQRMEKAHQHEQGVHNAVKGQAR